MKRHLTTDGHTACGLRIKTNGIPTTDDPAQVTCLACQRTLYMADQEVRWNNQQPRRRNRRKKG